MNLDAHDPNADVNVQTKDQERAPTSATPEPAARIFRHRKFLVLPARNRMGRGGYDLQVVLSAETQSHLAGSIVSPRF